MTTIKFSFCPTCGTKLPDLAKFCPQCGLQIGALQSGQGVAAVARQVAAPARVRKSLSNKQIGLVLVIALTIWLPAWKFQEWMGGKRPVDSFNEPTENVEPPEHDPEIAKLQATAKEKPENLEAQQALAVALVNKLQSSNSPSNELVFASMDALNAVLKLKPNDPDALIAMGDISFNQQIFNKASDFYARYLGIEPTDNNARSRYASSLAFNGKFDDAIKELNTVLAKDPKNFNATAYLAITYAQMGKKPDALKTGEKALGLAPNDEARARFSQFLDEVKKGPADGTPAAESPKSKAEPKPDPKQVRGSSSGSAVDTLAAFVRSNPVAGSRFTDAKDQGNGVIALYFTSFPMDAMPPFVKDKFINGIKFKAMDLGVQTLVFIDQDSGKEMERAQVKGNS